MNDPANATPCPQPPAADVVATVPPAPSPGKRLAQATRVCSRCDIGFTKAMLAWHLRNDHRVIACKICGARVISFLSMCRFQTHFAHFCSYDCRDEAGRRRLCPHCLRPSDRADGGVTYCTKCRRNYWHTQAQIREVTGVLGALGKGGRG